MNVKLSQVNWVVKQLNNYYFFQVEMSELNMKWLILEEKKLLFNNGQGVTLLSILGINSKKK